MARRSCISSLIGFLVLRRDGDVEVTEDSSHSTTATSAASSSAFTLIETAHPVFGAVRKLWNSPTESHRVVGMAMHWCITSPTESHRVVGVVLHWCITSPTEGHRVVGYGTALVYNLPH